MVCCVCIHPLYQKLPGIQLGFLNSGINVVEIVFVELPKSYTIIEVKFW